MKNNFIFLFLALLLINCSASVSSTFSNTLKPLTIEDKVAFLDLQHNVPEGSIKIGEAKYGDSGFSVDCDFNSNLIKARTLARQNGANIIKIIEKKNPDLWSSCYRMKIEFYFYSGKVEELPQIQLQLN